MERKGSLDSISDYLSLQECKVLLNDITERVIKQGYAEDIELNDSGTILTYFIEGEKYDYALIPSMSEDGKYSIVRAKLIYSP